MTLVDTHIPTSPRHPFLEYHIRAGVEAIFSPTRNRSVHLNNEQKNISKKTHMFEFKRDFMVLKCFSKVVWSTFLGSLDFQERTAKRPTWTWMLLRKFQKQLVFVLRKPVGLVWYIYLPLGSFGGKCR